MSKVRSIRDVELNKKKVLIRVDFNVPIINGVIADDTRIVESLETIKFALQQDAKIFVVSHLGSPLLGAENSNLSMLPIANRLKELLKCKVNFVTDWINGVDCNFGEVVVCENVRFLRGEVDNDVGLAKKMAKLCDVFIMDAFASAHRAHSSTAGIAQYAKASAAGLLMLKEIESLDVVLNNSKKPTIAIFGGSKISTKLTILRKLVNKFDTLIVGGGIANTFLAAQGHKVGSSMYEKNLVQTARDILNTKKFNILLPQDVVVATEMSDKTVSSVRSVSDIQDDDKILDVGPKTISLYECALLSANTILWNGPIGVFEYKPFSNGTKQLAKTIASSKAYSVAGGGDTVSAIKQFHVEKGFSYISTGGGAFLEYLEGKTLPGINALLLKDWLFRNLREIKRLKNNSNLTAC